MSNTSEHDRETDRQTDWDYSGWKAAEDARNGLSLRDHERQMQVSAIVQMDWDALKEFLPIVVRQRLAHLEVCMEAATKVERETQNNWNMTVPVENRKKAQDRFESYTICLLDLVSEYTWEGRLIENYDI